MMGTKNDFFLFNERGSGPFGRELRVSDGRIEVAAALDVGIRIVHLSLCGKENLFYRQPQDLSDGLYTEEGWRIYGGHRLWIAPESEKTYSFDGAPVQMEKLTDGFVLTQAADKLLHLEKTVELRFCPDGTVSVRHQIKNCGTEPVSVAAWGISAMAAGGEATVPLPRSRAENIYCPHRMISLWNETSLADKRVSIRPESISLRQDALNPDYCKLGVYSPVGQIVYRNKGQRLTICFKVHPMEQYTDLGSNVELFANTVMQEVETLGVFTKLLPGESTCHTENWKLEEDI